LQTPVRKTRYKPEHIAQFLQEDWYERYFAHMNGINPKHVRRTAAIRLCQLAAGGPVHKAANLLGIPHRSVGQSIKILHSWARNSPEPTQFETALRKLADELDSAPHLIDYKRRREALNCWCIEPGTWQLLLKRLRSNSKTARRMELGDRKRQTASILVWARVTQGEHTLAPHPIRDRLPPAAQKAWRWSAADAWSRFQTGRASGSELDLKGILDQYADTLASRIDRAEFR
jgi:hypothetical protein